MAFNRLRQILIQIGCEPHLKLWLNCSPVLNQQTYRVHSMCEGSCQAHKCVCVCPNLDV